MPIPKVRLKVTIIISNVIFPSSFLVNKREIIGELLNKVQPIPSGRVLKTICWRKIPILVPKIIDKSSLNLSVYIIWNRGVPLTYRRKAKNDRRIHHGRQEVEGYSHSA